MGKCLFVTGTGTDVGKTYVTGLIVKKLVESGRKAGYYKAALSGAEPDEKGILQPGDVLQVKKMAGLSVPAGDMVSYVYREAVSPHLAAKWNGMPLDLEKVERDFLRAKDRCDYLTMEGSGGILCPLRWDTEAHILLVDLVEKLGIPVLVVADAGLGAINGTVLTVEHLQRKQIPVQGVFFNNSHPGDPMEEDNARMVEEMTGIKVMAWVARGAEELDMESAALASLYQ